MSAEANEAAARRVLEAGIRKISRTGRGLRHDYVDHDLACSEDISDWSPEGADPRVRMAMPDLEVVSTISSQAATGS